MKLKIILTGATGMVGEGVLHECLQHPDVEKVLSVSRKASGITDTRVREIIHADFYDLSSVADKLSGYNTCLFCLGTTSVGKKEAEYHSLTYELTMHFAKTVSSVNPGMVFCYISGAGTDSKEKSRMMWARVKGKTENDLMKLPFKAVYNFRPGIIKPTKGMKNTLGLYKWIGWTLPFLKLIVRNSYCTLKELGQAMIYVAANGYEKNIIEVRDIHRLGGKIKN